jgi:DNA-binding XRE family transcriptional regulator
VISKRLRLLRNEYNFSQEKMSEILGISKKTLVQIEKDRVNASWTVVVAVCGLFRESEIIKMTIGEDPIGIAEAISFDKLSVPKNSTSGGRMFWKTLKGEKQFRMQRHLLSGHYRVIDGNDKRWVSSFDQSFINKEFNMLLERGEDHEEIE